MAQARGFLSGANSIDVLIEKNVKSTWKTFTRAVIQKYGDQVELIGGYLTIKLGTCLEGRRYYAVNGSKVYDRGVNYGIPVRCDFTE